MKDTENAAAASMPEKEKSVTDNIGKLEKAWVTPLEESSKKLKEYEKKEKEKSRQKRIDDFKQHLARNEEITKALEKEEEEKERRNPKKSKKEKGGRLSRRRPL